MQNFFCVWALWRLRIHPQYVWRAFPVRPRAQHTLPSQNCFKILLSLVLRVSALSVRVRAWPVHCQTWYSFSSNFLKQTRAHWYHQYIKPEPAVHYIICRKDANNEGRKNKSEKSRRLREEDWSVTFRCGCQRLCTSDSAM